MQVFTFDVGWTTARPIVVDQFVSRVTVAADSFADATILAALMVMRPSTPVGTPQMPTSTTLVL